MSTDGRSKLVRPSVAKQNAAADAAKLTAEDEHRLLIRMRKTSHKALKTAAFERDISIKSLVLTLARDAGIPVDPADIKG